MAIKSIVEFTIQPGRRDEFVTLLEVPGGATYVEHPRCRLSGHHALRGGRRPREGGRDRRSGVSEGRDAMLQSEAMGAFAPLFEPSAAPFSVTVVKPLH